MKPTYCLFIVLNVSLANWKKISVIKVLCCLKLLLNLLKNKWQKKSIPLSTRLLLKWKLLFLNRKINSNLKWIIIMALAMTSAQNRFHPWRVEFFCFCLTCMRFLPAWEHVESLCTVTKKRKQNIVRMLFFFYWKTFLKSHWWLETEEYWKVVKQVMSLKMVFCASKNQNFKGYFSK